MATQTAAEREMAEVLLSALNIEHIKLDEVDPAAPLFGNGDNSWGLDSIDALEIALAIQMKYAVELRSEDEAVKKSFASLSALTDLVAQRRNA